ncbi:unnamed protein product [Dovyalis caffra]|uniref:Uncharacterized protein n=1 Tax=Dovyalis caffra TaxID=77055 RepID=A0AAV1RHN2_9ROSI|nr:unnamed protein product [Dovyalis caffra]
MKATWCGSYGRGHSPYSLHDTRPEGNDGKLGKGQGVGVGLWGVMPEKCAIPWNPFKMRQFKATDMINYILVDFQFLSVD